MNVGRPIGDRLMQNLIHQLDHRSITGEALKSTAVIYGYVPYGFGIKNSNFYALSGNIGNILGNASVKASTAGGEYSYGIKNSQFIAGGNIGNITTERGSVDDSQFIAGLNVGANLALDKGVVVDDVVNTGAAVGNVDIQGWAFDVDIVASVKAATPGSFGANADADAGGTGGKIGTVVIGLSNGAFGADGPAGNAIEADTIGDLSGAAGVQVSIGGNLETLPGVTYEGVRIREL